MSRFIFGSFVYEYLLIRQNRKTFSLTVKPDLRLIVKAPIQAKEDRIELFLRNKWIWLEQQLSRFKKYQRKIYKKEYVSGESFFYLGRQYELVVKRGAQDLVLLSHGKLLVATTESVKDAIYNKYLLKKWYARRTREVFNTRLRLAVGKFKLESIPELVIQTMSRRWGSYVNKHKIILNPLLINASTDCIDYVIVHELCHFFVKKHNEAFYALLNKKYSGWKKVKEKLENRFVYF